MEIGFSRKSLTLIAGLLLVLSTTFALGQGISTGSISGTVEDQQHAVVAGATVTATSSGTNQQYSTTTNSQGFFALRGVPSGNYTVTVEAPKFTRLKMSDVAVNANRDTALGARTLSIGTAEVVTVEAGAPLVESHSSQITSTFESKTVADLPLYGSFDMLAYFTPGVVSAGSNGFSNNNGADLSVNGQRGRSNNFQIDGQSNNDNSVAGPSIFVGNQDIIAEFNIITNQFGVEYGRNSGSVVNYVTKSGTNAFHGSAFEYHTNSLFDSLANQDKNPATFGFCIAGQDPNVVDCQPVQKPAKFIENRYGGTLGGPIWKDKAWFFGSYYGDRIRSAGAPSNSGAAITPTPAGIAALAAAFPGNRAVGVLQAFGPHAVAQGNPTVPGGSTSIHTVSNGVTAVPIEFGQVTRNVPQPYNDKEYSGRGDIQLTSKDRFFARYFYQDNINFGVNGTSPANVSFAQGNWVDVPGKSQQIALDWTRTWTQAFVNQGRFSYSRANFGFENGPFAGCNRADIQNCPPRISLTGGNNLSFGLNNNLPQGRIVNNTQWQDNASWVVGRHSFKFGGEYARQRSPNVFLPNINGTFTYGGLSAGACPVALSPVNATDCGFSRFLAGVNTLSLADGPTSFNFKEQDAAAYFGTDWRVKDNLTLTLGMRWEFFQQAVNLLHDISVANLAANFWDPNVPTNVTTVPQIPEDKNNFAPSFGFAWTPRIWQGLFGQDKTVFRGGFRINYEPAYYNIFLNIATSAPVVNNGTVANGVLPNTDFTGSEVQSINLVNLPRGAGINPGARNRTDVDPDFHNPYTETWSFGIQRQITNAIAVESRYVGNHTVGNFQTLNANPQLCTHRPAGPNGPGTGACDLGLSVDFPQLLPPGVSRCDTFGTPGFATGRADCAFTNVRRRANTAFSIYHGIQNELRLRNFHGLSAGLSYTFSKTIDNVSEIFSTFSGATTIAGAQNPFDPNFGERSLSGLDFRHVASLYFTYELPWHKNQQGFLGHLLGGWQVSPTWRYNSGQSWTPAQFLGANSDCQPSFDTSFFGGGDTCRPFDGNHNAAVDTVGFFCDGAPGAGPTAPGACPNAATGNTVLPFGTFISFFDPCINTAGSGAAGGQCAVTPIQADGARWIYNNDAAASIFGTPFGNVRRNPGVRGQATNAVNMNVLKTTKLTEKVSLRFEAQAFNLFNHQFLGNPDPFIDDGNFAVSQGSFGNNFFNNNGGDFTNVTISGIGRRRLVFGLKVLF